MPLTALLAHRLARGLSAAMVADRAGMSLQRYVTLEDHLDRATADEFTRLATALGVSATALLRRHIRLTVVPPEVEPAIAVGACRGGRGR